VSPNASGGIAVLVVEDDEVVRMGIMDELAERGLEAMGARDAAEALTIVGSEVPIALLIVDIGLPGMDGRALADLARAARPDLKILFLTGYPIAEADAAVPHTRSVEKPIELHVLASIARSMIEDN
jgi:CheY-like chemotaxis protein